MWVLLSHVGMNGFVFIFSEQVEFVQNFEIFQHFNKCFTD